MKSQGQRGLGGYSPRGHRVGQDWSDLAHVQGAVTHAEARPLGAVLG